MGKNSGHRDDACKVRAPENRFIFVSAGINGWEPEPGGSGWSAYDEPGKLVELIPDTADDPVTFLAQLWGEAVQQHLNRALTVNPAPLMRFLDREASETLNTAMFAGRTKQGEFVMVGVNLSCDCVATPKRAVLKILREPLPDESQTIAYGMKPVAPLVKEMIEGNSERARTSMQKFEADHPGVKPSEVLGLTAVGTIEFVRDYAQSEYIGGPVDAVEMRSNGDIRWIQRKANCPDQR